MEKKEKEGSHLEARGLMVTTEDETEKVAESTASSEEILKLAKRIAELEKKIGNRGRSKTPSSSKMSSSRAPKSSKLDSSSQDSAML